VLTDFSPDTVTTGPGPDMVFASTADRVTGLTASDVAFLLGP
jgi:hypothetical protein